LQRALTTVTLLGLLVATAAAFAITEHLKLIRSPVYGMSVSKLVSPTCHCATGQATIGFELRHADTVTLTIVHVGRTVATLISGASLSAHQPHAFVWKGHNDLGAVVPDGVYHPELHLEHARRKILLPNRIVVDTVAPKVLAATGAEPVLFVGPGRSVAIRYVLSEQAHPVVYLGRHVIVLGRKIKERYKVKWGGTLRGRPLRAGTYVLSVGAVDLAGNETPAGKRKNVRVAVRYIEVAPAAVTVRAGARFTVRVETAAPRYTWRLGRKHGSHRGKVLRLRAPAARGRYRLVVTEHGHPATAVLRVRAK
jgi:hypothetical protein